MLYGTGDSILVFGVPLLKLVLAGIVVFTAGMAAGALYSRHHFPAPQPVPGADPFDNSWNSSDPAPWAPLAAVEETAGLSFIGTVAFLASLVAVEVLVARRFGEYGLWAIIGVATAHGLWGLFRHRSRWSALEWLRLGLKQKEMKKTAKRRKPAGACRGRETVHEKHQSTGLKRNIE